MILAFINASHPLLFQFVVPCSVLICLFLWVCFVVMVISPRPLGFLQASARLSQEFVLCSKILIKTHARPQPVVVLCLCPCCGVFLEV